MNRPVYPGNATLLAENLAYEINDRIILDCLSFALKGGEVLFIEGENGSGKTTLIRIICGLIQPDAGQVCWNGLNVQTDPVDCYQHLTYIGHATGVKPELTTLENLHFFCALGDHAAGEQVQAAIDWAGLRGFEDSPCRHLSYGQQRRIALARLATVSTSLWVLDEPFSGLDKNMIGKLQDRFIEHTDAGGLLVLSSHQALDLDRMNCHRIPLETRGHAL